MRLKYVYYEHVWDEHGSPSKKLENPIFENVEGDTCSELMEKYFASGHNHDCYKYSPREIVGVYD